MQYHLSYNLEHRKWVLKDDRTDHWYKSSWYKSWAIKKSMKFCRQNNPSELIIHLKNGHIEETRVYH